MTPGSLGAQPFRCSDAARDRRDEPAATAPPATRLLLVEVPGPWGRDALRESRLDRYVAGRLAEAAARAGVRVLLVRRPGGHAAAAAGGPAPATDGDRTWALADVTAGTLHQGAWRDPRALLDLDLDMDAPCTPSGGPPLALVCTHSRHDVCCALRGRPVAAALAAADVGHDVWECSHLGGDRFAANVLLLPSGDFFGGLDPDAAVGAVRAHAAGRLDLAHHRGRYGRGAVQQAALHRAATALGDDRRDVLAVLSVDERPGDRWAVEVSHDDAGVERRYVVHLSARTTHPHRLTCRALAPSGVRTFELDGLEPSG